MNNPVVIIIACLVVPWLWGWGVEWAVRKTRLYRHLPEPRDAHQHDDDAWYYQI